MISRAKLLRAVLAGALLATAPMAHAALTAPVKTDKGLVKGVASLEPGVSVFKGIPFGKAPVGQLRWKAPQPIAAWKGVRVASKFGNVCLQPHGKGRPNITVDDPAAPPMSEDCLYLNVWSGAQKAGEKRPVMLWIYGGAYTEGGGSSIYNDGSNLAAALGVGAAVDPQHHRPLLAGRLGPAPDVQIEAVLAHRRGRRIVDGDVGTALAVRLQADIAEPGAGTHALPGGDRLRRLPAQLAHRRPGEGDALEHAHAGRQRGDALDQALVGPHRRGEGRLGHRRRGEQGARQEGRQQLGSAGHESGFRASWALLARLIGCVRLRPRRRHFGRA